MVHQNYQTLLEQLPHAYAYHQILTDQDGRAVDYVFLDMNRAFEDMTGLKRADTLNRRVTEVLPGIENSSFDWISVYGQVATSGRSTSFEQYFDLLGRWYEVTAFSDRTGYFAVLFREITKDVEEMNALKLVVSISQQILLSPDQTLDCQAVTDTIRKLSGAEVVSLRLIGQSPAEPDSITVSRQHADLPDEIDASSSLALVLNIAPNDNLLGEIRIRMPEGQFERNIDSILILTQLIGEFLERKHVEEQLSAKTGELEDFFGLSLDLLCIADMQGHFLRVNQAWADTLGYTPESLAGSTFLDYVHPDDHEATRAIMAQLSSMQPVLNFVNRYRAADGSYRFIEWRSQPKGRLIYGAARDVTNQRQIEDQLYNEKEQFKTTLLSVGDGIIATDHQGRIEVINKIAEQLTGWTQQEAIGQPFAEVFRVINEYSRFACVNVVQEVIRTGQVIELDHHTLLLARNGTEIPIEDSAAPIRNKAGQITGVVIVFRDFTEKREKQRQVEYLSFHDHLTGLYNRRYYEDSLNRLDTPRNWPLAILVIDVNGLKLTNDAYGHEMGDRLIRAVADILRRSCRADDIIARTGGDEFVILLPQSGQNEAAQVRQRIIRMAAGTRLESVIISMAVGFAIKSSGSQTIHDVQKEADNQMYKDKLKYSKAMRSQTIETVLRQINNKYDSEQVHTEKVSEYCGEIARALSLSEKEISEVRTVGALHDIGKIAIPPDILNKQGKLSHEEWEMIRGHAATGYNILKSVDEYAAYAEAVLHHHERWDGKGYPAGLSGADVPLYSRIVAIVDAYEAMTSLRPYQQVKTRDEAIVELLRCSGTQFDPRLVQVFVDQVLLAGMQI